MKPVLVLMVKEPRPGRVKSRLGAGIGMVPAAHWYRLQALDAIRRLKDPRWNLVLAVSPDVDGLKSRVWPKDVPRLPQGGGDLGVRMERIMKHFSPAPTCIIGSDIPDIGKPHICDAFAGLGPNSAVIGPSDDGGYWLIGLKNTCAVPYGFLQGVRWSSEFAREDSQNSAKNLNWAELETLSDVDTHNDLIKYQRRG